MVQGIPDLMGWSGRTWKEVSCEGPEDPFVTLTRTINEWTCSDLDQVLWTGRFPNLLLSSAWSTYGFKRSILTRVYHN